MNYCDYSVDLVDSWVLEFIFHFQGIVISNLEIFLCVPVFFENLTSNIFVQSVLFTNPEQICTNVENFYELLGLMVICLDANLMHEIV